jgi:oligoendopeptidase F
VVHERVEKGEALSGETFTAIYADILRRYHGHDQKVMTIDDAYTVEWAYIPHFYYNFYVYKYATSLAASSLFAADVLAGKEGSRDRYLSVLEAGGSEYPHTLLERAGVDLATPAPYEALVKRMNDIMDEIEGILDRRATARR